MTELDPVSLRGWVGRTERRTDVVTPRLVSALRATVDIAAIDDSEAAPPGIHWCLAPQIECISRLGEDGHPERGGFLPPVALPRRMWAGSELVFDDPIRVGDEVQRVSRIADVNIKEGRSGRLCFVTVEHELSTVRGTALTERQDIVYRDETSPPVTLAATPANPLSQWRRAVRPDSVLLFRYSALTFNSHRIHFDRDYCREREGYPGLVVHGPLQATYLIALATQIRGRAPRRFAIRFVEPLFDDDTFTLNGSESDGHLQLWVANHQGRPTARASATW